MGKGISKNDVDDSLRDVKELREKAERKLEHISRYGKFSISPEDLYMFKEIVIPEIKKRKIAIKEISVFKLPQGETLEFLFSDDLDLESVAVMYMNGRKIKSKGVIRTNHLTLLGIGLKTDDLIKQFRDVEVLDIRGNYFETFPSSIMNFKATLKVLNLMGLMLERLPDDFGEFVSLTNLNLSENLLTELRDDHISKMTNLDTFKCFDNRITEFHVKYFPPKLTFIDASKNKITRIPPKFPETLKELHFHHNEISTPLDVCGLTQLKKLVFSNNKISEARIKGCTKLVQLDLSHNNLSDDSITGLDECTRLEEVYLSLNNLTEKIFDNFPKGGEEEQQPNRIRKLCLGYNKISSIPPNVFSEHCIRLRWLDVSGNQGLQEIQNSITTLLKEDTSSHLTLILGDLPDLKDFPKERIDKKLGYFAMWGNKNPVVEADNIIDLLSKESSPDCFSSDFSEEEKLDHGDVTNDYLTPQTSHCSIKGPYRPQNEDAYIDTLLCDGKYHLIAVLDGHGGKIASNFAAKKLPEQLSALLSENKSEEDLIKKFREAIAKTNQILKTEEVEDGTTFVSILFDRKQDIFIVANLGDSRGIISYKKKNGNQIQLTRDHKPTDPIELKWMEETGIHILENSKVDNKIGVTRSIGDFKYDLCTEPEFGVVRDVSKEVEFVVLCCDGVFDVFESEEVLEVVKDELKSNYDLQYIANKVVNLAVSNNSRDNISAIIVDFCGEKYYKENKEEDDDEDEGESSEGEEEKDDGKEKE